MRDLVPGKLHVTLQAGASAQNLRRPRRYTLTHSDATGDLFLTIGAEYDRRQIGGLYTRLMRDEVLAEWTYDGPEPTLHVHVHVSGGPVFGGAAMRSAILHQHMRLVLEAFRYGDAALIATHPELDRARICVHFASKDARYNQAEEWGPLQSYA